MQPQERPASPSDFTWYHSEGDDKAMPQEPISRTRAQRTGRGEKMAEALKFEKADELGNPIRRLAAVGPTRVRKQRVVKKKQRVDPEIVVVVSSDDNDTDYVATEVATEPEDSEGSAGSEWPNEFEEHLPSNDEVRHMSYFILYPF
jgi:hypothetical protein